MNTSRSEYVEVDKRPEVGTPRGVPCVEVYRGIGARYAWRVVATAQDDSDEALRAAKALALELDAEIHAELMEAESQRRKVH